MKSLLFPIIAILSLLGCEVNSKYKDVESSRANFLGQFY